MFFIQDKITKVVLYQGNSDGDLFTIPMTVFSKNFSASGINKELKAGFHGKMVKTSTWHKRLGHPSEEVLSATLKPLSSQSHDSSIINYVHPMVTRLKSGIITQTRYKGYIATLLALQSLQISEEKPFVEGYSFIASFSDVIEPSTFKKVATIPHWQLAM